MQWAEGWMKVKTGLQHGVAAVRNRPRTVAAVLASWALVWAALWAFVPGWVKPKIEEALHDKLARAVKIEEMSFRPWSLEVELKGLDIASADGKTSQLHIGRIYVDAELASLWHGAPVLDEVLIEAPHVHLARLEPGRYDVDDVIRKLSESDKPADDKPTQYALYNVKVTGGQLDFDDRPAAHQHQLREFDLTLPFISNLPSKRQVKVQPHLSLLINGQKLDTSAQATPFAPDKIAQLRLQLPKWDIQPYLGYWPQTLPTRPTQGHLTLDLGLAFDEGAGQDAAHAHKLSLSGLLALSDWQWVTNTWPVGKSNQAAWLAWQDLEVHLKDVEPLKKRVVLDAVTLTGLRGTVFQDKSGRWMGWNVATSQSPAKPDAKATQVWSVAVEDFKLVNNQVQWLMDGVTSARAVQIDGLNLHAQKLTWPQDAKSAPMQLSGSANWPRFVTSQTSAPDPKTQPTGTMSFAASGLLAGGTAQLRLSGASLTNLQTLLPMFSVANGPEFTGRVSTTLNAQWMQAADQSLSAKVEVPTLVLEALNLNTKALRPAASGGSVQGDSAKPLPAGVKRLEVSHASILWPQNQIKVERVDIDGLQAEASRDAQGVWVWESWFAPSIPTDSPRKSTAPAWRLELADVGLQNARLVWWDAAASGVLGTPTSAAPQYGHSHSRSCRNLDAGHQQSN